LLYAKLLGMSETNRYTVRFPNPLTHYAEVEGVFPTAGARELELFMAVWTPGSYLVREYSRHLEKIEAFALDGRHLKITKTRKNRWLIEINGETDVRVTYRLYCHELSVRTNWVDEEFAMIHGAATYLTVAGHLDRPHQVRFELPSNWSGTACGMERTGDHCYLAADYDTLVDSPVLLGNLAVHEFVCAGKSHHLVNSVSDASWDVERSITDTRKLVEKNHELWGSLPYDAYWFLNILVEDKGGGGLEHKNSCALIASRYATRTRSGYTRWLELVSHEFFHVWNVKRLRPVELGPFDYETENFTRGLWVAEGFTQYYGGLMAARAGVITRDEYLGTSLAGEIETLQTTPGRFTRAVDLSSFDAWIKLYRPDDNSVNASISYYTKGAVIAFLLDAKLRAEGRSVDELMRKALAQYSGSSGFTGDEIFQMVGGELGVWLREVVEGIGELDYAGALDFFGLRFKPSSGGAPKVWLGFATRVDSGRLIVASVAFGTPAHAAGFSAEDEVIAIDNSRVMADQWQQKMEQIRPGECLAVLVCRRGRLVTVRAAFEEDPGKRWILEVLADATAQQKERLNAWLEQPQQL
jgi:predicted metalloprotease with PDZ domain